MRKGVAGGGLQLSSVRHDVVEPNPPPAVDGFARAFFFWNRSGALPRLRSGRILPVMMETLAELQRLRQQLRLSIARLMNEAESDLASAAALTYTRLASECQKLDRDIELCSKVILDEQPPEGLA